MRSVVFFGLGLLMGIAVGLGWSVRVQRRLRPEPVEVPPERDPSELAAPLPTVRGVGFRDWVTYYTGGAYTWADVVREFYRRAAERPHIASFFAHTDMTALQSHFAKAMILVTSKGLTWGVVDAMGEVHAEVRDEDGNPITGKIFDEVVGVLVEVLQDYRIPEEAIGELAQVVPPLREAIVREAA
jgi:truncated hemoglobin YjbI